MGTRWLALGLGVSMAMVMSCGGDDDPSGDSGSQATEGSGSGSGTASGDSTEGLDPMGMSFFVSSMGNGANGGNFGGVEGADAFCQQLAEAAGEGARTWHAYLSTSSEDARDRIGDGPWYNFSGQMIAADVASLHNDGLSNDTPQHVLTEYGEVVNVGDQYDILTGSNEDGTFYEDRTCNDWTSGNDDFRARVGHSSPPNDPQYSSSWNSAHGTGGCSEEELLDDTGIGRVYCFAID